MLSFNPMRWVRFWRESRRQRTIVKKRRSPLTLEELENRVVPALYVWTGANHATDNNWSDNLNWSGNTRRRCRQPPCNWNFKPEGLPLSSPITTLSV